MQKPASGRISNLNVVLYHEPQVTDNYEKGFQSVSCMLVVHEAGDDESDSLRTMTIRFRKPRKEGTSTASCERQEVLGLTWIAYTCLYF